MPPEETIDATKPRKILKVFVNTDAETDVEIHEWKINAGDNKDELDHPRVDVQTQHLCYSTILDPLEPKIETWEVSSLGQLGKAPLSTMGLPFVKAMAEFSSEPEDDDEEE